jgi:hypothetical protein
MNNNHKPLQHVSSNVLTTRVECWLADISAPKLQDIHSFFTNLLTNCSFADAHFAISYATYPRRCGLRSPLWLPDRMRWHEMSAAGRASLLGCVIETLNLADEKRFPLPAELQLPLKRP